MNSDHIADVVLHNEIAAAAVGPDANHGGVVVTQRDLCKRHAWHGDYRST